MNRLRGKGDVLIDLGSPVAFSGGPAFTLSGRDAQAWFKFTTLGDGAPGDMIRLSPYDYDQPTLTLGGVAGDVEAGTSNARSGLMQFQVGGPTQRTGVIEFDLSQLLEAYEDPNRIAAASVTLRASSTVQQEQPPLNDPFNLTKTRAGGGNPSRVFFSTSTYEETWDEDDNYNVEIQEFLWLTDGSAQGTRVVSNEHTATGVGIGHRALVSRYICTSGDCYIEPDFGPVGGEYELSFHDGQSATVVGMFSSIGSFLERNDEIYFIGSVGDELPKLYRIRLDALGAPEVNVAAQSTEGGDHSMRFAVPVITDAGVFYSYSFEGRYRLWMTRGTLGSQTFLGDFDTGSQILHPTFYATSYADGMLFSAHRGAGGEALWFSDGTDAGTRLVIEFQPFGQPLIHAFGEVAGQVFFIANSNELWVTDATTAGTSKVRDLFIASPTFGRGSQATVVGGYYVVSKVNHDVGTTPNVTLFSIDKNGEVVKEARFEGAPTPSISSLVTAGDVAVANIRLRPVGTMTIETTSNLVTFDPATGNTSVLSSVRHFNTFHDIALIDGGPLVMIGPVPDDQEVSSLLWRSDFTPEGRCPSSCQGMTTEVAGKAAV